MEPQKVFIKTPGGEKKFIGYYDSPVLTVRRKRSKHFFHSYSGWGFDKKVLKGLITKGLQYIQLYEEEEKVWFAVNFLEIDRNRAFKNINFPPHGEQMILPEYHFKRFEEKPILT